MPRHYSHDATYTRRAGTMMKDLTPDALEVEIKKILSKIDTSIETQKPKTRMNSTSYNP